jgi:hypothetical protein
MGLSRIWAKHHLYFLGDGGISLLQMPPADVPPSCERSGCSPALPYPLARYLLLFAWSNESQSFLVCPLIYVVIDSDVLIDQRQAAIECEGDLCRIQSLLAAKTNAIKFAQVVVNSP